MSKTSFRKNQLKTNSPIFLQLGIILSLIIVYSALELEFIKKVNKLPNFSSNDDFTYSIPIVNFDDKTSESPEKEKKKLDLEKIIVDDHMEYSGPPENFKNNPSPNDGEINLDSIVEIIPIEKDEPMPINFVQQAPRYPGCKEKTETAYKKCLNQRIMEFVSKKFNANLTIANNIKGKQKIQVQFEIDKNDEIVNIKARSAHKNLEKEAKRVIDKLPKMIPGKQQDQNVSVTYNLPISFYIK